MAILTISRQFGSGGEEIGQAVAALLNYEYVDKKIILQDLKAAGQEWGKWGEDFDENCPTIWDKYDWSFRGFSALIKSCILEHVLGDNVVIMGRGGNFLLEGIPPALMVLIIAPDEKRIERVMLRESLSRDTAKQLLEKTDRDRACLIKTVYGRKWDDPSAYDMIINSGMQHEEEVKENIKAALLEKDRCPFDIQLLMTRARAAKVKAGLLTDRRLFIPTLDVSCDSEGIILHGIVHSPKEHRTLEEEAKKMAGNIPVRCELRYRK